MQGLRNRMGVVMGWFRSIRGKVTGPFHAAGTWLWNAGSSIISGFINGIKSKFGDVKATLGSLTSKLTSWKGPESLDKVILKGAGQLVIGGFAEGLESQYGRVRKSLGDFTRDMGRKAAASKVGNALSDAMSGDLSALQASRGALPRRALAGASMGQHVTVIVKVAGNVIGEKDFAKRVTPTVRDELKKIGNRNSGRIFGE